MKVDASTDFNLMETNKPYKRCRLDKQNMYFREKYKDYKNTRNQ